MKKLIAFLAGAAFMANAAEPEGYYSACEGKTGEALLKSLLSVVGPHTKIDYKTGLWEVYKTSDVRPDGTLWDMYSTKQWPKNFTKCGNYKVVGDCVNKEHSMPKSWFDDAYPMYSDAYHLYPTDGKVNGQRSNHPFGECANGKYLAANGNVKPLGRLGTSTFPGYTGTVFEPDDQYKGDFARTYFYMAAAYNDRISSWHSDMMAGNNYPVYREWAVNMLLKWSRQDPVSEKEIVRNEEVSKHQKNRNPFIDHPELAEYIWGNKKGVAWYVNASTEPQILEPADGSLIDLGMTSTDISRSTTVIVKGTALTSAVTVTTQGTGFTATPATLSADAVNNDGAEITVSYRSASATHGSGVLLLKSGDATSVCTIICTAVEGLPVGPATEITENSFMANWSCIDDPSTPYSLHVYRDGETLPGYPRQVRSGDEKAIVTGLEPETAYSYTVSSPTQTSEPVEVTTSAPQPSISFLYDGELQFFAIPGEPSEIAEILMEIENISENVTIIVKSPFQVSTDKSQWSTSITLQPEEERFYMRLFSQSEGEYSTSVTATAGSYFTDDLTVEGKVSQNSGSFHEDFESTGAASYNDKTYVGSACSWQTNALFEKGGSNAYPHDGEQAARMPKSGGYLTMLESKPGGMGTLSFWAHLWRNETTTAKFDVKLSADNGTTWETVGTITIPSTSTGGNNAYAEYTLPINKEGMLRLKLEQTAGARLMLDDLRISDYRNQSGVGEANKAEYHSWDAYSRSGRLILESNGTSGDIVSVYSIDGTEVYSDILPKGETALNLTPGLYVAVVRDFSRRVLVK